MGMQGKNAELSQKSLRKR